MLGALGGVGVGRLRGPAPVEPQQEEVWGLGDPHLHVHLHPGRQLGSGPKNAASRRLLQKWAYFAAELDGGGAVVRLQVGVVGVQHHLDGCVQVVHAHHRLAGQDHRGDQRQLPSAWTPTASESRNKSPHFSRSSPSEDMKQLFRRAETAGGPEPPPRPSFRIAYVE